MQDAFVALVPAILPGTESAIAQALEDGEWRLFSAPVRPVAPGPVADTAGVAGRGRRRAEGVRRR